MVRGGVDEYALTLPVILEVGKNLSAAIKKDRQGLTFVDEMIPKMRHALYQDLGVRFPGVHVRTDSPTLEPDEYSIFLNEVPVLRGKILETFLLTNENPETSSATTSRSRPQRIRAASPPSGSTPATKRSCKRPASSSGNPST